MPKFMDLVRTALLFILLAIAVGACSNTPAAMSDAERLQRIMELYRGYQRKFSDVPDVTVEQLREWRQSESGSVILVDAREPFEQQVSIIPGAITEKEFEQEKRKQQNSRVVVYCTIGYRSWKYTSALREQGIEAYNLKGSVLAWAHAGGKFVTPAGESTRRAHVYGPKWDLLPAGYHAVTERPGD